MATAETLISDVSRVIQDSSYSDSTILDFLNQGVNEIAGLVKLPNLEDSDTVDTDTSVSYVSLPSDYMKDLFYCYNNDKNWRVDIYPSLGMLQRKFAKLDQSGTIVGVTVKGSNLHYQRIPSSSETLLLNFYRSPTDMSANSDTPDGIPSHLHKSLLVNFAAREIFKEIEQDVTGKAVNTEKYKGFFKEAMAVLVSFVGPPVDQLYTVNREVVWEDYL